MGLIPRRPETLKEPSSQEKIAQIKLEAMKCYDSSLKTISVVR
jgi:hypothetical protein